MPHRIEIIQADITTLDVDAIVNAANTTLLGGGGVDGAIHRAAGPDLLAACRGVGGCPTGEARLTRGYNLKARYVMHAVGPIWRGGGHGEASLLAGAYRSCMLLAKQNNFATIAFPAISTGAYGFPIEAAATIAIATLGDHLRNDTALQRVVLACFDAASICVHENALSRHRNLPSST
ncbi:MAG: O-acetyl-ADP-ribose deacetylase [Hyphomicrobiaceae bacterium]